MNWFTRWQGRRFFQQLRRADPAALHRQGEARALDVFHDSARRVPAYARILREQGVDPDAVRTLADFSRLVPLLKKDIFSRFDLADLCRDGDLGQLRSAMVSSGFSGGVYSFGLTSRRTARRMEALCDVLLDHAFDIRHKKTFLINALGMGFRAFTSLPMAETSVRSDMVLALVKKLAGQYDQIVILCATYFAKQIAEEGAAAGAWGRTPVHLVVGEDWFPENYRDYLMGLLGIRLDDPSTGSVLSSMGVCEMGISLFRETPQTVRIRRLAERDPAFRARLFGESVRVVPMLFHYDPVSLHLETVHGELTFTTLDPNLLVPLIRYQTGDLGAIHRHDEVRAALEAAGRTDWTPDLRLPLVSVAGRSGRCVDVHGTRITPELIKSALYAQAELAGATTGYFRIALVNSHVRIEVQLRADQAPTEDLRRRYLETLACAVGTDCELALYPHREFPRGVGLVYEEKFRYV